MPITSTTTRENFEAHLGDPDFWIDHAYPGAEAGLIRHSPACPHYDASKGGREIGPGYADCVAMMGDARARTIVDVQTGVYGTENGKSGYLAGYCHGPFDPLYMHRTHVGLVLDANGEFSGRDDSDFYALVWDEVQGRPEKVVYASTRGWTYPNHAEADATPEVVAKYEAWCRAMAEAERKRKADEEARRPAKDKRVKVVKGRKVPVGTTGVVFWVGAGMGGKRVGFRTDAGEKHFTDASNVEVILDQAGAAGEAA